MTIIDDAREFGKPNIARFGGSSVSLAANEFKNLAPLIKEYNDAKKTGNHQGQFQALAKIINRSAELRRSRNGQNGKHDYQTMIDQRKKMLQQQLSSTGKSGGDLNRLFVEAVDFGIPDLKPSALRKYVPF